MRLSIVTIGHVHAEQLAPLSERFTHLEQLILDVDPARDLSTYRAELNRAIDAATSDWILIVKEREQVEGGLAEEVAQSATAERAWGFRIRTTVMYAGRPLRIRKGEGEIRLFHRRHYMRRAEGHALLVHGTVVRLQSTLRAHSFASVEEHRQFLQRTGVPHSMLRRVLLFIRDALAVRTLDRNTLRYIWVEAGFDKA